MYYEKSSDYGVSCKLTQDEAKEMFRIDPLELKFTHMRTAMAPEEFRA